jgi:hypothetical protein
MIQKSSIGGLAVGTNRAGYSLVDLINTDLVFMRAVATIAKGMGLYRALEEASEQTPTFEHITLHLMHSSCSSAHQQLSHYYSITLLYS